MNKTEKLDWTSLYNKTPYKIDGISGIRREHIENNLIVSHFMGLVTHGDISIESAKSGMINLLCAQNSDMVEQIKNMLIMERTSCTNYEFVKSLTKEDMSLFLCYVCIGATFYGIHGGLPVKQYKEKLPPMLFKYKSYGFPIKENGTWEFLSQEYEGKEVYQHITDMTVEEISGIFGLLAVSDRARTDILCGDILFHILRAKSRPIKDMMVWLESEVR